MLDKEKFKENFKYYDNEVIVQVMDIFLNDYKANLEDIKNSIDKYDFKTINRRAHALKGVVSYMSPELSELCYALELKGEENDGDGLQILFNQLKEGILKLVEDLKSIRVEYAAR
jgi:HPt (histidine-containing phosphotransfer) domain-containing protein